MPLSLKRLTIRLRRLSAASIAAACAGLAALLVCAVLGQQYKLQLRHSTLDYGRSNAAMLARVLDDHLERSLSAVEQSMRLADSLVPPGLADATATAHLRQVDYGQNLVRSISLLDGAGRVLASSNPENIGVTLAPALVQSLALDTPLLRLSLHSVWGGRDLADARLLGAGRAAAADAAAGADVAAGADAAAGARLTSIPVVLRSNTGARFVLATLNPTALVTRHQQILASLRDSSRIHSLDGRVLAQANLGDAGLGERQPQDPVFSTYLPDRGAADYLDPESGDPVAFRASDQFGSVIKVRLASGPLLERVAANGAWVQGAALLLGLLIFMLSMVIAANLRASARANLARQRSLARLAASESELRRHRDHLSLLVRERTAHLERATAEAEQANRAKSDFLANMSHELRTPMHAILSFAQFGLDRLSAGGTDRLERYFGNIRVSGQRLLELLNDLLDLSKLEAGRMEIRKTPCRLDQLASDAVEDLRALLLQARLDYRVEIAAGARGLMVLADAARLRQVLHNLIGNAIKFTPSGGTVRVLVDCRHGGVTSECDVALLSVRDSGCGIPEDELELIFDKFAQSSKTKTAAGGTGLGLAICREIASAHGGSIRASNNQPGPGAQFEFALPIELIPLQESAVTARRDAESVL